MRPKKIYIPLPEPDFLEDDEVYTDHLLEWTSRNQTVIHKTAVNAINEIYTKDITRPIVIFQFCEYNGEPPYADLSVHREDKDDIINTALKHFLELEDYKSCAWIKTINDNVNKIINDNE